MAFILEYVQSRWATSQRDYDTRDMKNFTDFFNKAEAERQRE